MNGSANSRIFGLADSCLSASWVNFVHGTRSEYLSTSCRKTMPLSLYEITSPVMDVPSVKAYVSAPAATNSPQSQKPRMVQKILCTGDILNKGRRAGKANSAGVAEFGQQILDDPVCPDGLQFVRRRAMLPDGKTNQFADVGVQRPLRQQSGQIARQHVAAATLRQMRIAGRIHVNFPLAP